MPESLLTIADKSFSSRLIVGSGKYLTNDLMVQAQEASAAAAKLTEEKAK